VRRQIFLLEDLRRWRALSLEAELKDELQVIHSFFDASEKRDNKSYLWISLTILHTIRLEVTSFMNSVTAYSVPLGFSFSVFFFFLIPISIR